MKRFCSLTFFLFALMHYGYAQDASSPAVKLAPLNNINIMMDGGCTYYTYDSLEYKPHSMINIMLAIKLNQIAIIRIAGKNENTYLKVVSQNNFTHNTDTSTYRGHGYTIKLNTHEIYKIRQFYSFYEGTVTVTHHHISKKIKIHGKAFVYTPKKRQSHKQKFSYIRFRLNPTLRATL